jgi:hypothetical protein
MGPDNNFVDLEKLVHECCFKPACSARGGEQHTFPRPQARDDAWSWILRRMLWEQIFFVQYKNQHKSCALIRSKRQARGCACGMFLSRVIARADLKIAAFSVIQRGGGDPKEGSEQSARQWKNHWKTGSFESKCNKKSLWEGAGIFLRQYYSILFS